jgi:acyl transferase domain-containing protein
VTAGAFSVSDGAEVVLQRQQALRVAGVAGRMAAVGLPGAQAETLVTLVGSHRLAVAVENGSDQSVLSGTDAGIDAAAQAARAAGASFAVLDAPSPFHNPLLAPVAADLAVRLRALRQRPLRGAVYSPILGRAYTDEDVLTDHLAAHLVQRVRFAAAVERLATGSPAWVEVGAGATLSRLVARIVPSATTVGGLDGTDATLEAALAELGVASVPAASAPVAPAPAVAPVAAVNGSAHADGTSGSNGARGHAAAPLDREGVAARLRALYAEALEYPEEVFTDDVALERDLGIDSVKQTELLARGAELYGLPAQPADFRLSDYDTMGKVVDYVLAHAGAAGAGERPVLAAVPAAGSDDVDGLEAWRRSA